MNLTECEIRSVLFMGLIVEWKSRTLQFESHILCGPVQLGLAIAVSGGGASVKGGLASARGRALRRNRV
jgi:hypothetical protein